jgi:hypothetical protein
MDPLKTFVTLYVTCCCFILFMDVFLRDYFMDFMLYTYYALH